MEHQGQVRGAGIVQSMRCTLSSNFLVLSMTILFKKIRFKQENVYNVFSYLDSCHNRGWPKCGTVWSLWIPHTTPHFLGTTCLGCTYHSNKPTTTTIVECRKYEKLKSGSVYYFPHSIRWPCVTWILRKSLFDVRRQQWTPRNHSASIAGVSRVRCHWNGQYLHVWNKFWIQNSRTRILNCLKLTLALFQILDVTIVL